MPDGLQWVQFGLLFNASGLFSLLEWLNFNLMKYFCRQNKKYVEYYVYYDQAGCC